MNRLRARTCPSCGYFIGFSVAARPAEFKISPITNSCLNCNYKLPVHSIVWGFRRSGKRTRPGVLRLVRGPFVGASITNPMQSTPSATNTALGPEAYAHHLRVIGQHLENFQLEAFNIECTPDSYLVWLKSDPELERDQVLARVSKIRLRKLWLGRSSSRGQTHDEHPARRATHPPSHLRFSAADLDRMEREQCSRRRPYNSSADGHALSQLLRTVGDYVGRRGERLLGIAWQTMSISIVVETPQGRKEIDIFRPDNLYDLWVSMYLRRQNRASSELPR